MLKTGQENMEDRAKPLEGLMPFRDTRGAQPEQTCHLSVPHLRLCDQLTAYKRATIWGRGGRPGGSHQWHKPRTTILYSRSFRKLGMWHPGCFPSHQAESCWQTSRSWWAEGVLPALLSFRSGSSTDNLAPLRSEHSCHSKEWTLSWGRDPVWPPEPPGIWGLRGNNRSVLN